MRAIIIWIALLGCGSSCREISPLIPPLGPPEAGERKVLIEEFTGVQCVNCPQGSAEIENLIALYGSNLVAVSIHSGFFADPFKESRYDFRTDEGQQLEGFLGEPVGYPSAVINRQMVPGKTTLQAGQASWAGLVAEEIARDPQINLNLSSSFNASNRSLNIDLDVVALADVDEELRLTVMITEDNISDLQLTPSGEEPDYLHRHVLRDIITRVEGDGIGMLARGQLYEKTISYTLPDTWDEIHCKFVVFVSRAGQSKEVLQVEAAAVVS